MQRVIRESRVYFLGLSMLMMLSGKTTTCVEILGHLFASAFLCSLVQLYAHTHAHAHTITSIK